MTSPLSRMLKKDSPAWTDKQTLAVKNFKQIMKNLSPLHIPSDVKRILQNDASDKH